MRGEKTQHAFYRELSSSRTANNPQYDVPRLDAPGTRLKRWRALTKREENARSQPGSSAGPEYVTQHVRILTPDDGTLASLCCAVQQFTSGPDNSPQTHRDAPEAARQRKISEKKIPKVLERPQKTAQPPLAPGIFRLSVWVSLRGHFTRPETLGACAKRHSRKKEKTNSTAPEGVSTCAQLLGQVCIQPELS